MGVLAACLPTYGMLIRKAKTVSQQSRSRTRSPKPLQKNRWAKVHCPRITETDLQMSQWSKGYGQFLSVHEDRDGNLEHGRSHATDELSDESDVTIVHRLPD